MTKLVVDLNARTRRNELWHSSAQVGNKNEDIINNLSSMNLSLVLGHSQGLRFT